jgi:PKD repeat protein
MSRTDTGISEVASETLIIAMIVVLTVVIGMLVFGIISSPEKTAYLVPQFSIINVSDKSVITVFDRGGDPVYFNGSPLAKYKAELYVDTQAGSFRAIPVPALTVFKPGDRIYAYYTGSGFVLTNAMAGVTFVSLPAGKISVRFVDVTSGVLISREDLVKGIATLTVTATPTGTPTTGTTTTSTTTTTTTATSTTTTTTTSTATVTSTPTATTTTPLPTLAANFNAAPAGGSRTIKFTDSSTGNPTSWSWDFGNGATGSGQPINYHYSAAGSYSVKLTVTRSSDGATSSITKTVAVA